MLENGIYTVTDIGSGATNWILTRATDYDSPAEIQPGDLVVITAGTTNLQTGWLQTNTVVLVGTSPIAFNQFNVNPTYDTLFPAVIVTGTSDFMLVNHKYIANNAGLVTLTLPAIASPRTGICNTRFRRRWLADSTECRSGNTFW